MKLRRKNTSKYLPIDYDQTIKILRRKQALINRVYAIKGDTHSKAPLHQGKYRNWEAYYSIQNHFPAIFGINEFGLSSYEPETRKAQALQLKGYLLIFEQLIANFQSQISHLKDLYSISADSLKTTYYSQPLLDAQIDQIHKFYDLEETNAEDLATTARRLIQKLEEFHPHLNRKSRILDYMLALYGERFSQNTLKRVNLNLENDSEYLVVKNKAKMLELVRYFNHNSSKAPSNLSEKYEKMSGFELKIKILLNMDLTPRIHTEQENVLDFKGAKAIRISDVTWKINHRLKSENVERMTKSGNLKPIHQFSSAQTVDKLAKRLFHISHSFLRLGFFPSNYYIYHNDQKSSYFLLLKDSDHSWYLLHKDRSFDQVMAIYETCLDICYTFSDDDYDYSDIDDCLFIDHIMLRPKVKHSSNEPVPEEELSGFYSFNLSSVFPNWGDKFGDEAFRQLVEETIAKNIPAHMLNHILWLDQYEYTEFKQLFRKWSHAKEPEEWRVKLVTFLYEKIVH